MSYPLGDRIWHRFYDEGVPREVSLYGICLPDLLKRSAEAFGSRTAAVFMGKVTTFSELFISASRFASLLESLGVKPRDRVALLFLNVPAQVICYYGALMAGAVVVQINPLGTEADMEHALRQSEAKVIVALDVLLGRFMKGLPLDRIEHVLVARLADDLPFWKRPALSLLSLVGKVELPPRRFGDDLGKLMSRARMPGQPVPISGDDLALIQFTGGTTGIARGAMLTHGNLAANVEQCRSWLRLGKEGKEVVLCVVPFFHVYGMTVAMNLSVRMAATMILHHRFDVRAILKSVQKHRPTQFHGIQLFYGEIARHPDCRKYDLSSLRVCISGAGPLMREVQERFESLTGARVSEGYGLTEASPVTHANPLYGTRKIGSIGIPIPSTDARIVDLETGDSDQPPGHAGELVVRGPQVMKGYWKGEDETKHALRNGWLYTGDIAVMDEDGFFRIVDRKKDLIKSGGENVYARDVEEVLFRHPAVLDAGVAGVPDEKWGEKVKAYVVLKEGRIADGEELIRFCRERLAGYQTPKEVEFRRELPRVPVVGKLLRRKLVEEEIEKRKGGR